MGGWFHLTSLSTHMIPGAKHEVDNDDPTAYRGPCSPGSHSCANRSSADRRWMGDNSMAGWSLYRTEPRRVPERNGMVAISATV